MNNSGPYLEKHHAPHFTLIVDLNRTVIESGRESPIVKIKLHGVDVGVRQRVVRLAIGTYIRFYGIGKPSNAIVIVARAKTKILISRIAPGCVDAVNVFVCRRKQGPRVEIGPTLTHTGTLLSV